MVGKQRELSARCVSSLVPLHISNTLSNPIFNSFTLDYRVTGQDRKRLCIFCLARSKLLSKCTLSASTLHKPEPEA